MQHAFIVQDA